MLSSNGHTPVTTGMSKFSISLDLRMHYVFFMSLSICHILNNDLLSTSTIQELSEIYGRIEFKASNLYCGSQS